MAVLPAAYSAIHNPDTDPRAALVAPREGQVLPGIRIAGTGGVARRGEAHARQGRREEVMDGNRLYAVYQLDTFLDAAKVARVIAGEQSAGTFVALPEDVEAQARSAQAVVEDIRDLGAAEPPALPGAQGGVELRRYRMTISWPSGNFGTSLPNIVATVAGNLFELKEVAGLKIKDIVFPDAMRQAYPGPAFGIEGTRELAGVHGRPLIGTIVKPSVGLGARETAVIVKSLCDGGIDFIKDDELQADGPACPFDERVLHVMNVIREHRAATGRQVMYAFNLTGSIDEMRRRHDLLLQSGATCAMVSLNAVGISGLMDLRRYCRLPIHAHRNGWGYLGRSANNGWDYAAWQKIWRLIGVDHMHVNGIANKFWEPDDSVMRSARACTEPLFRDKPCAVMPVFSSGQTVWQAHPTHAFMPEGDLIYCAGGGVVAHPDGIAAGVESLRLAWEAARSGRDLESAARGSPVLAHAMEKFASKRPGSPGAS
jgi:ribulose-bisphosphate carboxylase large chain